MDGGKEGREEVKEGICIVAVVVGIIVINEVCIRSNGARLLRVIGDGRSTAFNRPTIKLGSTWSPSLILLANGERSKKCSSCPSPADFI